MVRKSFFWDMPAWLDMRRILRPESGAIVLDPTEVAFKLAEAIVDPGPTHSKIRRFAAPDPNRRGGRHRCPMIERLRS